MLAHSHKFILPQNNTHRSSDNSEIESKDLKGLSIESPYLPLLLDEASIDFLDS